MFPIFAMILEKFPITFPIINKIRTSNIFNDFISIHSFPFFLQEFRHLIKRNFLMFRKLDRFFFLFSKTRKDEQTSRWIFRESTFHGITKFPTFSLNSWNLGTRFETFPRHCIYLHVSEIAFTPAFSLRNYE